MSMSIQAVNATNVQFRGTKKKTERGNEYSSTNISRNICALAGATGMGILGKTMAGSLKSPSGKRQLITSLNNMGKSLINFGGVKDGRHKIVGKGISSVITAMVLVGALAGGIIGGAMDSSTNDKRAKAADKVAKVVQ